MGVFLKALWEHHLDMILGRGVDLLVLEGVHEREEVRGYERMTLL